MRNAGGVGKEKENQEFTLKLCQEVKPKLVLFSIGRDKHQNPRKEVVKTIFDILPNVHIICTQLAKHCSPDILPSIPTHLNTLPSKGREANHCCGGTVVIQLNESETTYSPNSAHRQFVKDNVHSRLCRNDLPLT